MEHTQDMLYWIYIYLSDVVYWYLLWTLMAMLREYTRGICEKKEKRIKKTFFKTKLYLRNE